MKAESTSDPKTYAISTASIDVEGVPNQPPVCACLTPDKLESEPGKVLTWATCTIDPEGDPLEYRFLLKGPNHKDFDVMQDWCIAYYPDCPTWRWTPGKGSRIK